MSYVTRQVMEQNVEKEQNEVGMPEKTFSFDIIMFVV
jgi:hypothetical protein